jgi:hypothetical protein
LTFAMDFLAFAFAVTIASFLHGKWIVHMCIYLYKEYKIWTLFLYIRNNVKHSDQILYIRKITCMTIIQNHCYTFDVTFKSLHTHQTRTYSVIMKWKCDRFYSWILEKIRNDFQLSENEMDELRLIDINQPNRSGNPSDWGDPLTWDTFDGSNHEDSLEDYFRHLRNRVFYLKYRPMTNSVVSETETEYPSPPQNPVCAICLTEPRNLVFTPCNHLCACVTCGTNALLMSCPICRGYISNRLRIYV